MKRLIALVLLLVMLLGLSGCKSNKYEDASVLYGAGNYKEAIVLFRDLGSYKDSAEKLKECYIAIYGEETYNMISSLEVGDTMEFGTFEQDNNKETTEEKIIWRVLDVRGTSVLLFSDKILSYKCFNDVLDTYWANPRSDWLYSSIYNWLNKDFYSLAFTDKEQSLILKDNPSVSSKVFLLSKEEAEGYYPSRFDRACSSTKYADAVGKSHDSCACHDVCNEDYWMLRSVVKNNYPEGGWDEKYLYLHVSDEGVFSDEKDYERYVGFPCGFRHTTGIRPAIWISLDA